MILVSAYFLGEDGETSTTKTSRVQLAMNKLLIVAYDTNTHHIAWGNRNNNKSGESLLEYIITNIEQC